MLIQKSEFRWNRGDNITVVDDAIGIRDDSIVEIGEGVIACDKKHTGRRGYERKIKKNAMKILGAKNGANGNGGVGYDCT